MMNQNFVTVQELAEHLHCNVIGDREKRIYGIALMQDSTKDTLTYVPSRKIDDIKDIKAGVILTKASLGLPIHRTYLITRHEPYELLADTINYLIDKGLYGVQSRDRPMIDEEAKIAPNVMIGNGTVIESKTTLAAGVVIGQNVVIGKNCLIGVNTVIGSNTVIEDNAAIGSCCAVGTENFEYCKEKQGWSKIPVIGNVRIHNNVIIGGNVVIEKGTIGTTSIGAYTQIENLVQVGHEVKIGHHCHVVACSALAGWAEIGNYVDIYGQAAVSNNVKVGDNAVLLARSGVDKTIKENTVVWGSPAQEYMKEMRFQAFLRNLFRKQKG
ncbi:MAG: UDP-3-O-(3-hydroxymyristoyl)glucosamine N-acyltransferase [Clostridia bacterium]|nr:UDP-3-O-(3-hydroxymyristoyl)glucosamine N-acyltransferase [Clostridia bacterium]